jgi:hypothetical protein
LIPITGQHDLVSDDLYTAFLEPGLKKVELARRIGIPKTHIERLFHLGATPV